jgi:hypothetical protein
MTGPLTPNPFPRLIPGTSPQSWRGVPSLPSPLWERGGEGPGEGDFAVPSVHFYVEERLPRTFTVWQGLRP